MYILILVNTLREGKYCIEVKACATNNENHKTTGSICIEWIVLNKNVWKNYS